MKKEIAILFSALILLTGCASKTPAAQNTAPAKVMQPGVTVEAADPIPTTPTTNKDEDSNPTDETGEPSTNTNTPVQN